jgi:hypothetical protein
LLHINPTNCSLKLNLVTSFYRFNWFCVMPDVTQKTVGNVYEQSYWESINKGKGVSRLFCTQTNEGTKNTPPQHVRVFRFLWILCK